MSPFILDLQTVYDGPLYTPDESQIQTWIDHILAAFIDQGEITIRIVDEAESQALNCAYRQKDRPTNVLSFPFDSSIEMEVPLLGDLVICAPVVDSEAIAQHKTAQAHWLHMITHGCLHLLGYDHLNDEEAQIMESLEIDLLAELGYCNPYELEEDRESEA